MAVAGQLALTGNLCLSPGSKPWFRSLQAFRDGQTIGEFARADVRIDEIGAPPRFPSWFFRKTAGQRRDTGR